MAVNLVLRVFRNPTWRRLSPESIAKDHGNEVGDCLCSSNRFEFSFPRNAKQWPASWFIQLCKETLLHFARIWCLFRSVNVINSCSLCSLCLFFSFSCFDFL